jgi:flagellin-like protein
MKTFAHLKDRKAVSPLIGVLIAIAITVGIGLMVWGFTTGMFGGITAKAQVQVESVDLVKPTGATTATFTVTIKNTGTKPIDVIDITHPFQDAAGAEIAEPWTPNSGTAGDGEILEPGKTIIATVSGIANVVIGDTYSFTITCTCTDGSTFTVTQTVTCRAY